MNLIVTTFNLFKGKIYTEGKKDLKGRLRKTLSQYCNFI